MRQTLKSAIDRTLTPIMCMIHPKRCMSCDEVIDEEDDLCLVCRRSLPYTELKKWCFACGREKSECICKGMAFYFKKCVSVFKNTGSAKNSYYGYKFGSNPQYARFFAIRMAIIVKKHYADVDFDCICPVPTSFFSKSKYGFDHTLRLANELSDILGIPCNTDLLRCKAFSLSQHRFKRISRWDKVKKKYRVIGNAKRMNILLIDDIRTTGATLNACSHALLKAGAAEVYCITALATAKKKTTSGDKNGNRNRN